MACTHATNVLWRKFDERRWRLLDTVLQDKMFETLLQLIVEQDVPLHAVPVTDIVTAFVTDGGESLVAKHCLNLLSKSPDSSSISSSSTSSSSSSSSSSTTLPEHIALDMTKVYAFKAHQLFLQRKLAAAAASDATLTATSSAKLWPKADFLEAWSTAVPGLDVPHERILRGIALETAGDKAGTICYRYVPSLSLPIDPRERLVKLFAIKPKWPLSELQPYIEPLCGPGVKVSDLLIKYTRMSTDTATGAQLYSTR
eukprot:16231-Heterococcus_DN1.PRE.4